MRLQVNYNGQGWVDSYSVKYEVEGQVMEFPGVTTCRLRDQSCIQQVKSKMELGESRESLDDPEGHHYPCLYDPHDTGEVILTEWAERDLQVQINVLRCMLT